MIVFVVFQIKITLLPVPFLQKYPECFQVFRLVRPVRRLWHQLPKVAFPQDFDVKVVDNSSVQHDKSR
jgi:hypothetical protein